MNSSYNSTHFDNTSSFCKEEETHSSFISSIAVFHAYFSYEAGRGRNRQVFLISTVVSQSSIQWEDGYNKKKV